MYFFVLIKRPLVPQTSSIEHNYFLRRIIITKTKSRFVILKMPLEMLSHFLRIVTMNFIYQSRLISSFAI